jgi:hypothetical protein
MRRESPTNRSRIIANKRSRKTSGGDQLFLGIKVEWVDRNEETFEEKGELWERTVSW